jgi:hypothetical protein
MRHTFRSFTKIASRFDEGANHAGEFIRRYSPVTSPHHVHIAFPNHHPMPSGRIMPANLFAAIRPDDGMAPRRRYSPRRWNRAPTITKKRTGGKCPRCVMVAINR